MKLYLAGTYSRPMLFPPEKDVSAMHILESFWYVTPWQQERMIRQCKSFILDSGAFTFIRGSKGSGQTDLEGYARRYIDFINRLGVDLFFELDLDYVVGLDEVERYRRLLERETGKQPIPVWHHPRGRAYFSAMCREYPLVALGGIAIKVWKQADYPAFHWFIAEAHRHGAEIHGLGFTARKLREYSFDSTDSKSWLAGSIGGVVYRFNGSAIEHHRKPQKRRKHYLMLDRHNLEEWEKYQRWLDRPMA